MIPQSTADLYRRQQRLIVATLGLTRREWARMSGDFDRSWSTVGPRLALLTGSAQLGAARAGAAYVPRVLAETNQDAPSDFTVAPAAFAGVAADGRSLDGLLYGAVTEAKTASGQGLSSGQALDRGGRWLDMAIHTAVADAARQATQVSIAMRPNLGGYVRMVNPPCCSRCGILAGKFFRYNQGFQRHPRCDCTHIPARDDTGDFRTDPNKLVERGQITDLRPAEQHALDLGADFSQVINARRGTSGVRGLYTTEGTTRRGYASAVRRELDRQRGVVTREMRTRTSGSRKVTRTAPRPTPEAIYRFAHDRDDAVRLLAANGYIVGDIRRVAASAL